MKYIVYLFVFLFLNVLSRRSAAFAAVTVGEETETQQVANQKPSMILIYQEGCGSCRYMKYKVMTKKRVSEFLDDRFNVTDIDADTAVGAEMVETYGITHYPTFLILTPDGKETGRLVGGSPADQFVKQIEILAPVE